MDLAVSEKPLLYLPGEYDICAAVAGLVDEDHLIKGSGIKAGDRLIGLPSSGLHTNGYSLARKALLERGGFRLEQYLDELGAPLGEVLLLPHKNYVPAVFPLLQDEQSFRSIRGIAHITGGGLKDNLARILPAGLGAKIQKSSWQPPPIFALLQKCGNIPEQDPAGRGMFETFNMGIGMVIIADSLKAASLMERLRLSGEEPLFIGEVIDLPEADILARERVLIKT
ncbi:Phosphoribosylformylglycinamidine cyclo-ligase [subsurface metagenome]